MADYWNIVGDFWDNIEDKEPIEDFWEVLYNATTNLQEEFDGIVANMNPADSKYLVEMSNRAVKAYAATDKYHKHVVVDSASFSGESYSISNLTNPSDCYVYINGAHEPDCQISYTSSKITILLPRSLSAAKLLITYIEEADSSSLHSHDTYYSVLSATTATIDLGEATNQVQVWVNGALKKSGALYDYTLSGTGQVITFTSSLAVSDEVYVEFIPTSGIDHHFHVSYQYSDATEHEEELSNTTTWRIITGGEYDRDGASIDNLENTVLIKKVNSDSEYVSAFGTVSGYKYYYKLKDQTIRSVTGAYGDVATRTSEYTVAILKIDNYYYICSDTALPASSLYDSASTDSAIAVFCDTVKYDYDITWQLLAAPLNIFSTSSQTYLQAIRGVLYAGWLRGTEDVIKAAVASVIGAPVNLVDGDVVSSIFSDADGTKHVSTTSGVDHNIGPCNSVVSIGQTLNMFDVISDAVNIVTVKAEEGDIPFTGNPLRKYPSTLYNFNKHVLDDSRFAQLSDTFANINDSGFRIADPLSDYAQVNNLVADTASKAISSTYIISVNSYYKNLDMIIKSSIAKIQDMIGWAIRTLVSYNTEIDYASTISSLPRDFFVFSANPNKLFYREDKELSSSDIQFNKLIKIKGKKYWVFSNSISENDDPYLMNGTSLYARGGSSSDWLKIPIDYESTIEQFEINFWLSGVNATGATLNVLKTPIGTIAISSDGATIYINDVDTALFTGFATNGPSYSGTPSQLFDERMPLMNIFLAASNQISGGWQFKLYVNMEEVTLTGIVPVGKCTGDGHIYINSMYVDQINIFVDDAERTITAPDTVGETETPVL